MQRRVRGDNAWRSWYDSPMSPSAHDRLRLADLGQYCPKSIWAVFRVSWSSGERSPAVHHGFVLCARPLTIRLCIPLPSAVLLPQKHQAAVSVHQPLAVSVLLVVPAPVSASAAQALAVSVSDLQPPQQLQGLCPGRTACTQKSGLVVSLLRRSECFRIFQILRSGNTHISVSTSLRTKNSARCPAT